MEKEAEIAVAAGGGGLITWIVKKWSGRKREQFDAMQRMVDFWRENAENLVKEISILNKKYDDLNAKYLVVIQQNHSMEDEIRKLKKEISLLKK